MSQAEELERIRRIHRERFNRQAAAVREEDGVPRPGPRESSTLQRRGEVESDEDAGEDSEEHSGEDDRETSRGAQRGWLFHVALGAGLAMGAVRTLGRALRDAGREFSPVEERELREGTSRRQRRSPRGMQSMVSSEDEEGGIGEDATAGDEALARRLQQEENERFQREGFGFGSDGEGGTSGGGAGAATAFAPMISALRQLRDERQRREEARERRAHPGNAAGQARPSRGSTSGTGAEGREGGGNGAAAPNASVRTRELHTPFGVFRLEMHGGEDGGVSNSSQVQEELFGQLLGQLLSGGGGMFGGEGGVQGGQLTYEDMIALSERLGHVSQGATEAQIDALPTHRYHVSRSRLTDTGSTAGLTQCAVCLCDFEEEEEVKTLPCLHMYHPACIDRWLGEQRTCPVCKWDVTASAPRVE